MLKHRLAFNRSLAVSIFFRQLFPFLASSCSWHIYNQRGGDHDTLDVRTACCKTGYSAIKRVMILYLLLVTVLCYSIVQAKPDPDKCVFTLTYDPSRTAESANSVSSSLRRLEETLRGVLNSVRSLETRLQDVESFIRTYSSRVRDDGFDVVDGKWIVRGFTILRSWTEARDFCRNLGADLVVIDSKQKHDAVKQYTEFNLELNCKYEQGIWINGRDLGNLYVTATAEEVGYLDWGDGEPDTPGGCMAIWQNADYKHVTMDCLNKRHFICEKQQT